jgi:hypothetical protein
MTHVLALAAFRNRHTDYRVTMPVHAVSQRATELGVNVETTDAIGGDIVPSLATDTLPRVNHIYLPADIDVLVLPQPWNAFTISAIVWLRTNMPKLGIVIDITHQPQDVELERLTRRAAALADVVTCSTPVLTNTYTYDERRTFTVRDAMPASMLANPARALSRKVKHVELNKDRIVGWCGDAAQQASDLDVMQGALQEVVGADRTDGRRVRLRAIGPRSGLVEALALDPRDVETSGWLSPPLHRVALGELDTGLVPCADRARSSVRVLEYAAAGVPVIASKTPEHEELQRSGMPLWLVRGKRREWVRALRSVLDLDDGELRDLANAHRENVRQRHTVEKRAAEWAHAWKTAARVARDEDIS